MELQVEQEGKADPNRMKIVLVEIRWTMTMTRRGRNRTVGTTWR